MVDDKLTAYVVLHTHDEGVTASVALCDTYAKAEAEKVLADTIIEIGNSGCFRRDDVGNLVPTTNLHRLQHVKDVCESLLGNNFEEANSLFNDYFADGERIEIDTVQILAGPSPLPSAKLRQLADLCKAGIKTLRAKIEASEAVQKDAARRQIESTLESLGAILSDHDKEVIDSLVDGIRITED